MLKRTRRRTGLWVGLLSAMLVGGIGCSRSRRLQEDATGAGAPTPIAGASSGAVAGASGNATVEAGTSGASTGPSIEDALAGTVIVEGTPLCAGVACAAGEQCCLVTGTCFDPKEDHTCELPAVAAGTTPVGTEPGSTPCASDADCGSDEYCNNNVLCLGPGYCASRTNCPFGSGGRGLCGCNGITYPNPQSACFAGARVAAEGSCGEPQLEGAGGGFAGRLVTPCAGARDCADGEACCAITGRCYDEMRPAVCAEPPEGTYRACQDDSDCLNDDFCWGDGCDAPGGCKSRGSVECTGILAPVCGCDGQSYTSADCATAYGARIAHASECPAPASE